MMENVTAGLPLSHFETLGLARQTDKMPLQPLGSRCWNKPSAARYFAPMTKLVEKAIAAVRGWPADRQDDAAELLLALDRLGTGPYHASPEELAAIDQALGQVGHGRPATDAEVDAAFARFRE
jgi:hypothetical protein